MQKLSIRLVAILLATAGMLFFGCAGGASFNQYFFDETVRLKSESRALLRESGSSYALNAPKAEALVADIHSAYRDALLRSLNKESMRVWKVIVDAEQPSVAGALNLWKANDTLTVAQRKDFQNKIAQNFDDISKLEGKRAR